MTHEGIVETQDYLLAYRDAVHSLKIGLENGGIPTKNSSSKASRDAYEFMINDFAGFLTSKDKVIYCVIKLRKEIEVNNLDIYTIKNVLEVLYDKIHIKNLIINHNSLRFNVCINLD